MAMSQINVFDPSAGRKKPNWYIEEPVIDVMWGTTSYLASSPDF